MLAAEVSRQDLFKACESLFGTDIDASVEFLRYLKPAGVRAAYRKKAMETHPDRAILVAVEPDFLEKRFKEVNLAYQLLQEFLIAPWKYYLLDERGTLYERKRQAPRPASTTNPSLQKWSLSMRGGCRPGGFYSASTFTTLARYPFPRSLKRLSGRDCSGLRLEPLL